MCIRDRDYTEHLPDAVDFEDEDELADDDDLPEETDSNLHPSMITMNAYDDNNQNGGIMGIDANSLNLQLPEINDGLSQQFILEDEVGTPATSNALFMGMDANEIHLVTETGVLDGGGANEVRNPQLSIGDVEANNMIVNDGFSIESEILDNKHKKQMCIRDRYSP